MFLSQLQFSTTNIIKHTLSFMNLDKLGYGGLVLGSIQF